MPSRPGQGKIGGPCHIRAVKQVEVSDDAVLEM